MHKTILDGRWELLKAELAGELAPELVTTKTAVELVEGTYLVRFAGEIMDRGSFALGDAAHPGTMILRSVEGANAGRTIPCIYQLAGNRLRICYGLGGATPADFTTSSGDDRYLALYRRRDAPEPVAGWT